MTNRAFMAMADLRKLYTDYEDARKARGELATETNEAFERYLDYLQAVYKKLTPAERREFSKWWEYTK